MKAPLKQKVNFSEVINSLLSLLSSKEKSIIERRFLGKNKETLENIGQSYSITRERVRQIEAVAIRKLARVSLEPSIRFLHDLAYSCLVSHGKILSEDFLISEMLKGIKNPQDVDVSAMKLALRISDRLIKQDRNPLFRPFWYTKDLSLPDIKKANTSLFNTLKAYGDVMSLESLSSRLEHIHTEMIHSLLFIHWEYIETDLGWGLKNWRTINPRSIRDKVLVTLKKIEKPLHFNDIVRHVLDDFSSKKMVTPQAIHNDLIRHEEFVLVGRGLYGLKEWNMSEGTVCDVIVSVLKEGKKPMKRQDIIKNVLKKRDIRLGTISLNLQKYPFFKRVGRAVYEYDKSLDQRRRKRA